MQVVKKFAQTRTEWGSWGHRCIAESRAGIQRTPFCLWSAQSPCFHSQETYRLQTERQERWGAGYCKSFMVFLISSLTSQGVVHVKAIALNVFKSQTSVHKYPADRKQVKTHIQKYMDSSVTFIQSIWIFNFISFGFYPIFGNFRVCNNASLNKKMHILTEKTKTKIRNSAK